MDNIKPPIIVLGDFTNYRQSIDSLSSICELTSLKYENYEMGSEFPIPPILIICMVPPTNISAIEVAQSLRMNYSKLPIYFVTNERESFNRSNLQKNGFSDAFLFPNDRPIFESTCKKDIALASNGAVQVFRNVQLVDIEPGTELGFDLYLHLPANNRHVKYVSSKDILNKEKAKRLSEHQINTASINETQASNFYKYTADRLKALGSNEGITETEKIERREKAVRSLLTGIFSLSGQGSTLEDGRGLMTDCNEIVKTYVIGDSKNSWYERFLKISANQNGSYGHAADVSSLASLLAIGLGLNSVEDIALAGLLHDIGTTELPAEICEKRAELRTPEEVEVYKKHPQFSVDMIKNKKMIVSEKIMKIIIQHHENYDGTGYPSQVSGDRICIEAQVLRVADEIEKIISGSSSQGRISTKEAVKRILESNISKPGSAIIAPDLAKKILGILP